MVWSTYCAEKAWECELRAREERSPARAAEWRDSARSWRRAVAVLEPIRLPQGRG